MPANPPTLPFQILGPIHRRGQRRRSRLAERGVEMKKGTENLVEGEM